MKNAKNKTKREAAGRGMALGMALGAAIGAATGDLGLWLAIGVAMGAGFGAAFQSKGKGKEPPPPAASRGNRNQRWSGLWDAGVGISGRGIGGSGGLARDDLHLALAPCACDGRGPASHQFRSVLRTLCPALVNILLLALSANSPPILRIAPSLQREGESGTDRGELRMALPPSLPELQLRHGDGAGGPAALAAKYLHDKQVGVLVLGDGGRVVHPQIGHDGRHRVGVADDEHRLPAIGRGNGLDEGRLFLGLNDDDREP